MGQQSVGKSFALNHLVDTSFAGSAMRTTEGVWMSVTPTDKELIVALDFEGVDSIERSPQEDTFLVLFNTAISNLSRYKRSFPIISIQCIRPGSSSKPFSLSIYPRYHHQRRRGIRQGGDHPRVRLHWFGCSS
ncbi:hypothetical protein BGW80DRAFT_234167 [Lactifluus volemus]|nr:hypothetical protein BGW80DRAFT_234167 [Lactifluus volemus]